MNNPKLDDAKKQIIALWHRTPKALAASVGIVLVLVLLAMVGGQERPGKAEQASEPAQAEPAKPAETEPAKPQPAQAPAQAQAQAAAPAALSGPPLLPAQAEPVSLAPGYRMRIYALPEQQQPVLLLDEIKQADLLSLAALPDPRPVGLGSSAWRTEIEGYFRVPAAGIHTLALRAQLRPGWMSRVFRSASIFIDGRDASPVSMIDDLPAEGQGDAAGQANLAAGLHRFRLVIECREPVNIQVEAFLLSPGAASPALIPPLAAGKE